MENGGVDVPGNFTRVASTPFSVKRECNLDVCVVLPDRSRPSITINGARRLAGEDDMCIETSSA